MPTKMVLDEMGYALGLGVPNVQRLVTSLDAVNLERPVRFVHDRASDTEHF
jgi:hypothetical protein